MTDYLSLVTSEHADKPRFTATVTATVQPFVDEQAVLAGMPARFDVDTAVGVQLDTLALWVGAIRTVGTETLSDADLRTFIKARIAYDRWDGSIPNASLIWSGIAPSNPLSVIDHQNMVMDEVIFGPVPSARTLAFLTGGAFDFRPATVAVGFYLYRQTASQPMFGFDRTDSDVSGWDVGYWAGLVRGPGA